MSKFPLVLTHALVFQIRNDQFHQPLFVDCEIKLRIPVQSTSFQCSCEWHNVMKVDDANHQPWSVIIQDPINSIYGVTLNHIR